VQLHPFQLLEQVAVGGLAQVPVQMALVVGTLPTAVVVVLEILTQMVKMVGLVL
jgi:hypothetical protein